MQKVPVKQIFFYKKEDSDDYLAIPFAELENGEILPMDVAVPPLIMMQPFVVDKQTAILLQRAEAWENGKQLKQTFRPIDIVTDVVQYFKRKWLPKTVA